MDELHRRSDVDILTGIEPMGFDDHNNLLAL
jgi:hypothetical protein